MPNLPKIDNARWMRFRDLRPGMWFVLGVEPILRRGRYLFAVWLMMLAALAQAGLDPLSIFKCVACERDADGKIKRNKAKARAFLRAVGWKLPTTYVRVDHIIALACGPESGAYDDLGNMQLQWVDEAAEKDRWERTKTACDPALRGELFVRHGQLMPGRSAIRPAEWAVQRAREMADQYRRRVSQIKAKGKR